MANRQYNISTISLLEACEANCCVAAVKMTDVIISILFFVIIFCFLTFSCQWFSRTLRRYQDTRREFEEEQSRQTSTGNRISVFTVEHGQRTLINYSSGLPPRYPAHVVMKEELPPTYDDALKMQQVVISENTSSSTPPRRNSSVL